MELFDAQFLELSWRLLLAAVLGLIIGIEREAAHKAAGIRTHALVAMGAALFTIISHTFDAPNVDPTRIAAQIVVGIGFLGAGIIIFQRGKEQVLGLTTAAGVWVAAAIGMAVGFGFELLALFATVLTVLIFVILYAIEQKFFAKD